MSSYSLVACFIFTKKIFVGNIVLAEYNSAGLLSLINRIEKEYYEVIEKLCNGAIDNTEKIKKLEINLDLASDYLKVCSKLTREISHYITTRRTYFIPYIQELQEKERENHNCSTCSGKCSAQHELKLVELKNSHQGIKETLKELRKMVLPVHSDKLYPIAYRVLSSQMVLLENSLNELFFLEETYLIPRVMLAQKKMNAHG